MHKITGLFLLLLVGCDDNTQLTRYCEEKTACWLPPGKDNTVANIIFEMDAEKYEGRAGFCGTGVTVCEGEDVRCEGVRYPKEEMCDGIDNNCDGVIDDPERFWAGVANTKCYFEEIGECRYSEQACINGELVCLHHTSPNYGPEICDGKDNDCDGEYDEDYQPQFFYSGPIETASVGECRVGVTKCIDGREEVVGMVLPQTEICINGKDDDCDGLIDERESGLASVDYAFFIDFSGSMSGPRIDSVVESVCSFSDNPIFADSRFAIVGISIGGFGDVVLSDDTGLYLISDFEDIVTACDSLDEFTSQYVHTAFDEFQIDAVLRSFGNFPTSLSWSDRDRKIYIFSDEAPQTIVSSQLEEKLNEVIDMCTQNNFEIGIFTEPWIASYGWGTLASECGGFVEDIDNLNSDTYFEQNFLIWFGASC